MTFYDFKKFHDFHDIYEFSCTNPGYAYEIALYSGEGFIDTFYNEYSSGCVEVGCTNSSAWNFNRGAVTSCDNCCIDYNIGEWNNAGFIFPYGTEAMLSGWN